MKKISKVLAMVLSCATLFSLAACGNQATTPATTQAAETTAPAIDNNAPLSDGKTIKMLCITSSFGLNTTQLLYDVAMAEGATEVTIGRLYASGCTLEQHAGNASTNANAYRYTKINNGNGQWQTMENVSMYQGLKDEDWDIIFMQQGAAWGGAPETYGNYIDTIKTYVDTNKTNPNARYIWNMTWAYQADTDQSVYHTYYGGSQMKMYEAIVSTTKEKIVPRTDFSAIIPSGTAIQNARTSYFGDNLAKDTYHLNNLGAAIVAYGLFSVLTGKEITEVNLDIVAASAKNGINGAELIYEPLTEADKLVIMESVNNAIKNPWSVTNSQYPEKPE